MVPGGDDIASSFRWLGLALVPKERRPGFHDTECFSALQGVSRAAALICHNKTSGSATISGRPKTDDNLPHTILSPGCIARGFWDGIVDQRRWQRLTSRPALDSCMPGWAIPGIRIAGATERQDDDPVESEVPLDAEEANGLESRMVCFC